MALPTKKFFVTFSQGMLRRVVVLLAMVYFNVTQHLDAAKNIPQRAKTQRLINILEIKKNKVA
ncbi:hypothetical protein Ahy_B08g093439 isoform A [Arachis hypogaea]|uniref:Uncharacterized protein n=1 Tax=Arachis hypogaea TaxID=3818 RepID=A0A444Y611_ARAHY|nr:hypothetical protein Ahy_B08g093439 isoform A [Arachis hypogaea]